MSLSWTDKIDYGVNVIEIGYFLSREFSNVQSRKKRTKNIETRAANINIIVTKSEH